MSDHEKPAKPGEHVRIGFELCRDEDGYPPASAERVWARPSSDGFYEVDNIPFFVRNISVEDVIEARQEGMDLKFVRVVRPSNRSTLRVIVFDQARVPEIREQLEKRGCSTELNRTKHLSVDIPGEADLWKVRDWLSAQEAKGVLEFEDASIRHPPPSRPK